MKSDIVLLATIAQIPEEHISRFRSMMVAAFEGAYRNCQGDGKKAHRPMTPIDPDIASELERVKRAAERLFQALDIEPAKQKVADLLCCCWRMVWL